MHLGGLNLSLAILTTYTIGEDISTPSMGFGSASRVDYRISLVEFVIPNILVLGEKAEFSLSELV